MLSALKNATQRTLSRIVKLPNPHRGQFGPDHTVIEVLEFKDFEKQDPFILLMDDRLDGTLQAGPHPHAGFETVSYLIRGDVGQESGLGRLAPGDVEWTTTGSGIVHGHNAGVTGSMRLLQLWLNLPSGPERWCEPDHQIVPRDSALVRREEGVEVRLYSGKTGDLVSPTRNHVPVTLVNIQLQPGKSVEQQLPRSYNGFLYVIQGEATIGAANEHVLRIQQAGWLDRPTDGDPNEETVLRITNAASEGVLEVLLYAAQPTNSKIVSYGPFIGESRADIMRSIERYQTGVFPDV